MLNRVRSAGNQADSCNKMKCTKSSRTIGNTLVVCRLFSSYHKNIHFMYQSTLVSQFFILLYMFTKVFAFAVIVYIIFPFAVINGFYILFISPIRLFKLSSITSIPKSLRKVFTTSKKSSCNSSCCSIIKPVSK